MVKALEALVISGVYGVYLFVFLLNILNLMVLALNDHFLILMVKQSVLGRNCILYSRNLEPFEGHLQLLRVQVQPPQSVLILEVLAICLFVNAT